MTTQELFLKYKPKEIFSILSKKSEITGNYFACIYRKGFVKNKFGKGADSFEGAEKVITEREFEKFLNELLPYIEERNNIPSNLTEFPYLPEDCIKNLPG